MTGIPTTAQLLDAWDATRHAPMARRAAMLASLAAPELAADALADLRLGGRDRLLLDLRASLFGDELQGVMRCPACGQVIETTLPVRALTAVPDAEPDVVSGTCDLEMWRVRYRAPTCADALALADAAKPDALALIRRCVVEATAAGAPVDAERLERELPEAVAAEIARGIAAMDPAADLLLDVACPGCSHRWKAPLDVAAFLWAELSGWARRTLHDVACLARAFGWREADILALSPQRRADYLELLFG
jgi:hypothetical protein